MQQPFCHSEHLAYIAIVHSEHLVYIYIAIYYKDL